MTRLLVASLLALVVTGGCAKKKETPAEGGDPAKAGLVYVDVDCDKMIDHFTEVMLNDPTHSIDPAQKATIEAKLKGERANSIAACIKEKPTKKLTQPQYDCILAATSMMAMSECAKK